MMVNLKIIFAALFIVSSTSYSGPDKKCIKRKPGPVFNQLLERKKNVEEAIHSSIDLIQSLSELEKQNYRSFTISSSISYAFFGSAAAIALPGMGAAALSAGGARLCLTFGGRFIGGAPGAQAMGLGIASEAVGGTGAAVGAARAFYLFDGKKDKIELSALSYEYDPVKRKLFDPFERFFTEARFEFVDLQRKMALTKGVNKGLNWNNTRELNKNRLRLIDAFFMLELLILENEEIGRAHV